jgi:hypothetical protein
MVKPDPEALARAAEQCVGVTEGERGERERRAPRRGPRLVACAGDAERLLGEPVVGLELIVGEGPVLADPVERAQAEIAGVEAQGVAFPVKRAAADAARPFPLEPVRL